MTNPPKARAKRRQPIEAEYILEARRFVTANKIKNQQAREEADAKRKTVQAMHAVKVSAFDFVVGNSTYSALLDRPESNVINVRKLYVMVKEGDVTLDEFYDCISASQKAVTETLGAAVAAKLSETKKRGIDLIIRLKP